MIDPVDINLFIIGSIDAEALFIRTGMHRFRDSPGYFADFPMIDPLLPEFLRQNLSFLRLFGIDTHSVANPSQKESGRECHRNFRRIPPEIIIMEDVNLSNPVLTSGPGIVKIYPWIQEKIEAVPVVAVFEMTLKLDNQDMIP